MYRCHYNCTSRRTQCTPTCQPVTCRPCCCPAYCICCCRKKTTTPTPSTGTVTYNSNGGTGGTTENNVLLGADYTIKNDENTNVSRTGYTFTGWNTAVDQSGTAYQPGDVTNLSGNLTLYAQWTPIEMYTVRYQANGGTGEYSDSDIPSDTEYILKSDSETGITRKYYSFTGWNTKADGTGITYQPGDILTINSNKTLYAQWTHVCG